MLDHVSIGVSDVGASKAFFLQALAPLGIILVKEGEGGVGLGRGRMPFFWLGATIGNPTPVHVAFAANDRSEVDAFYREALAAGAKDNGAPGIRPRYHPNYYAAFVIGPDGHNIEVVCHRTGG
jgi:catechol 2,3-dioxygenase-like lactoylglutathione lyase family enzyme